MKIKQQILKQINSPLVRPKIAILMGVGEQTLQVQLRKNISDGRLTKMDALQAISEVVGCDVTDILESEKHDKQRRKHTA